MSCYCLPVLDDAYRVCYIIYYNIICYISDSLIFINTLIGIIICSTLFPNFDNLFKKKNFEMLRQWRANCSIGYRLHVTPSPADEDSPILSQIIRSSYFLPSPSTCTYNLLLCTMLK